MKTSADIRIEYFEDTVENRYHLRQPANCYSSIPAKLFMHFLFPTNFLFRNQHEGSVDLKQHSTRSTLYQIFRSGHHDVTRQKAYVSRSLLPLHCFPLHRAFGVCTRSCRGICKTGKAYAVNGKVCDFSSGHSYRGLRRREGLKCSLAFLRVYVADDGRFPVPCVFGNVQFRK